MVTFAEDTPEAGGEAHSHQPLPGSSRRKTFTQLAIAKVKSKARTEIFVLAGMNMAIAFTLLIMKFIDLMIVLGSYKNPTPSYMRYHIALYAIHDRDVYYSKSKGGKGEKSAPLISVLCDLFGYVIYTLGNILLLLAETRIIKSPGIKKVLVMIFIASCLLCGLLTIPSKWIFWGVYEHFIHNDEYLVVCTPATPVWGHVGGKPMENVDSKDLKLSFTAGRSLTYSSATAAMNYALQVCDGFSKVYKKLYGDSDCTCISNSKTEVMATVHIVNSFLAFTWISNCMAALWFTKQVKLGNPEFIGVKKPKPPPTPSQAISASPGPGVEGAEPVAGAAPAEVSTAPNP